MTLYNKDGSVYKLSAPNKLMRTQSFWEEDHIFYNLEWLGKFEEIYKIIYKKIKKIEDEEQGIVYKDEEEKKEIEVKEEIKEIVPQLEKEEIIVKEEQTLEKIFFNKEKEIVDKKETPKKLDFEIEKTFVFCLPAFFEDRKDELYGDSYKSLKYGTPFSMEAVIISQNDLCLEIWTNLDGIEKGSIFYPKTGFKRWWKVQEKKPKAQGWVLTMIPSDFHPSFDGV
jgi:hypothetical protein